MKETNTKSNLLIYAEATPNPATMKFVANRLMVDEGLMLEFKSPSETKNAPLASRLFNFPFVKSVFITANYVSVTKHDSVDWNDIAGELREYIRNYLGNGGDVLTGNSHRRSESYSEMNHSKKSGEYGNKTKPVTSDLSVTAQKIISVLDEYIRPAVEMDGGAIRFRKFESGRLYLSLQGACSGCPSSIVTLKEGIERIVTQMVPEVKEVIAD